jgi:hypothetical protein
MLAFEADTGEDEDPDDGELSVNDIRVLKTVVLGDREAIRCGDTAQAAGRSLARFGIGLIGRTSSRSRLSFEARARLSSAAYQLVRFAFAANCGF